MVRILLNRMKIRNRSLMIMFWAIPVFLFPQSLDWSKHTATNEPANETYPEMAYGGDQVAVKFGGENFNGTWEYDLQTDTWTETVDSASHDGSSAPVRRAYNGIAYVGASKIIIFGGQDASGTTLNDTWIYDSENDSWTNMQPAVAPASAYHMDMAWINDDKVLLYGGIFGAGGASSETWVYDLSENNWTKINPATSPGATYKQALVHAGPGKVLMTGGQSKGASTWLYISPSQNWFEKSNIPATMIDHMSAYLADAKMDDGHNRVLLTQSNSANYIYDLTDDSWTADNIETWNIVPREQSGMCETAMDSNNYIVSWGGIGGNYAGTHLYGSDDPPPPPPASHEWNWGVYGDSTFVPITTWLQNVSDIDIYKEAGFNVYTGFWGGISESDIATLREKQMHYIAHWNKPGQEDQPDLIARANIDDPLFIAWIQKDEPDNAQPDGQGGYGACIDPQIIIDIYNEITAFDTTGRQVVLNCGAGVARTDAYIRGTECASMTDMYKEYFSGADIASYDIYPVASPPSPMTTNDELWYVAQGVENMIEWTDGEKDAYWFSLECTKISGDIKPTPQQMWTEAWMGIVAGGTALQWFPFTVSPNLHNGRALIQDAEMLAAVAKVNNSVHDLATVINSTTKNNLIFVDQEVSQPWDFPKKMKINSMAKLLNDTLYIFTSATTGSLANTATFTIKTKNDTILKSSVIVMHEDREIELVDNQFSQEYTGQEVHLFKIGGYTDDLLVGINKSHPSIIKNYRLKQNYPNPFNPQTEIKYYIPFAGRVSLIVYNSLGQKVKTLFNGRKNAGEHSIKFDATGLASGIYYYQLQAHSKKITNRNNYTNIKKMLLIR